MCLQIIGWNEQHDLHKNTSGIRFDQKMILCENNIFFLTQIKNEIVCNAKAFKFDKGSQRIYNSHLQTHPIITQNNYCMVQIWIFICSLCIILKIFFILKTRGSLYIIWNLLLLFLFLWYSILVFKHIYSFVKHRSEMTLSFAFMLNTQSKKKHHTQVISFYVESSC